MKIADSEIRATPDHLPDLPAPVCDRIVETGAVSTDDSTVWVWAVLPDEKADIWTRIAIRDLVFDFIRARNGVGQAGGRISSSERNRSCPSLR